VRCASPGRSGTTSRETLIDLATLTGAIIMALGNEHAGLFSNDDSLADDLLAAGKAAGDPLWRFPLGTPMTS
jgi:leucyl aminopeptidase